MAPPKKYRTEAERKEAERRQRREYKARVRAKRKGAPAPKKISKGIPTMQEAMRAITDTKSEEPRATSQATATPTSDPDALPALDIPTSASEPDTTAASDAQADDANADVSATSASESSFEPSSSPSEKEQASSSSQGMGSTIGGDKLASMGAAAWCQLLAQGSALAESMGALGTPEWVIKANYESMEYILQEALKDSDVDPKKYHAYVTVCSGGWVAGNCYYGYVKTQAAKKEAEKKAAMEKKGIINGTAETIRTEPGRPAATGAATGPANGAGAPPASPPAGSGVDKPARASRYV